MKRNIEIIKRLLIFLTLLCSHALAGDFFMAKVDDKCVEEIVTKRTTALTPYIKELDAPLELKDFPNAKHVINWAKSDKDKEAISYIHSPFHMTLNHFKKNDSSDIKMRHYLETAIQKIEFKIEKVDLFTSFLALKLSNIYAIKKDKSLSTEEKTAIEKFLAKSPHVSLLKFIWKKRDDLEVWGPSKKKLSIDELQTQMKIKLIDFIKKVRDGTKTDTSLKRKFLSLIEDSKQNEIINCIKESLANNKKIKDSLKYTPDLKVETAMDFFISHVIRGSEKEKAIKASKTKFIKTFSKHAAKYLSSKDDSKPKDEFKSSKIKKLSIWKKIYEALDAEFKGVIISFSGLWAHGDDKSKMLTSSK